jgi:phage terminase large subunit-like protein
MILRRTDYILDSTTFGWKKTKEHILKEDDDINNLIVFGEDHMKRSIEIFRAKQYSDITKKGKMGSKTVELVFRTSQGRMRIYRYDIIPS